jgi:hypothetical protein
MKIEGRKFMFHRVLPLLLATLALFLFVSQPVLAADTTHDGTVVKAGDGKLTMTDKDGKEHSHNVGNDTKVTLDDKPAKLEDLKAGYQVTVTMRDNQVVKLAAHSKAK